jgi:hypothetical protein
MPTLAAEKLLTAGKCRSVAFEILLDARQYRPLLMIQSCDRS